ncbi:MAG TPA: hypothetical protein VEM96_02715 [Pyrinomonadaceae bacterium]|nr:hypothetical protein [Pyrinomonadaceae bacterium]
MKNFRRLCFAVLLAAVFTVPALAGDIASPGAPAPGDVHVPGAPAPGDTQGPAGQIPTPPSASGETHGPGATALGDIASPGFLATLLALLRMP